MLGLWLEGNVRGSLRSSGRETGGASVRDGEIASIRRRSAIARAPSGFFLSFLLI